MRSWRKPTAAFFVAAEGPSQPTNNSGGSTDDLELIMIANAKKIGLSLVELNEFTTAEFIKLIDLYIGDDHLGPRSATQDDINMLLS